MMGAPDRGRRRLASIQAVEVDYSDFHFNGFILRDASLRDAPLDEGVGRIGVSAIRRYDANTVDYSGACHRAALCADPLGHPTDSDPHGEERVFARLEP
jgi:hypothetical protein